MSRDTATLMAANELCDLREQFRGIDAEIGQLEHLLHQTRQRKEALLLRKKEVLGRLEAAIYREPDTDEAPAPRDLSNIPGEWQQNVKERPEAQ